MVMENGALRAWTTFLEQLRSNLATAQNRLVEAEAEVVRLAAQSRSVEDSIAAYREHHNVPIVHLMAEANGHGMTLTARRQAFLQGTARRNGDRLVLRETRDALIQAGLFRDVKQYRQQIGRLMEDMACWVRIEGRRGTYRLVALNGVGVGH